MPPSTRDRCLRQASCKAWRGGHDWGRPKFLLLCKSFLMLSIQNVSMKFEVGDGSFVVALSDVSHEVGAGEIVSILGPSGCGKTTLLNIVAGFLSPTQGTVRLNGKLVTGPAPERGMVFQQGALFEWMDVKEKHRIWTTHARRSIRGARADF